jgi:hypothetical protein
MIRCSFCDLVNEPVAKFCKRCHSDLAISGEAITADVVIEGTAEPPPIASAPPAEPAAAVTPAPQAEAVPTVPLTRPPTSPAPSAPVEAPLPPTVRVARLPRVELVTDHPNINRVAYVLNANAPQPAPPTPEKLGNDESTVVLPPRRVEADDGTATSPLRMFSPNRPLSSPPAPPAEGSPWPVDARPKLIVLRGQKINAQYLLYEGRNFLGRSDDKPVDIDLEDQEPADRVWASRQHAVITCANGAVVIEDLNSLNGTFVNRARIPPGQPRTLVPNDVIQVGTVQMKVII